MKRVTCFLVLASLLFSFTSCKKEESVNQELVDLEANIREIYDNNSLFTYGDYLKILYELANDRYLVMPMSEFATVHNKDKILVGMRHDVDVEPFKAKEMAVLESSLGIRSTYYMLYTARYYGKKVDEKFVRHNCMASVYQNISKHRHEIGIHNDLIAMMIEYGEDPFKFNKQELDFFRGLAILITGTAAHGSSIARETVPNYEIFSDFNQHPIINYRDKEYRIGLHSLKEYGFEYETYFVPFDVYISDSGGKFNVGNGSVDDVIKTLRACRPGQKVQILTHPIWWGKENS